jgi:hypothetical protein
MVPGDGTETLQGCGEYTYEQGELRGVEGEERRGTEKDGCPLITHTTINAEGAAQLYLKEVWKHHGPP